MQFHWRRGVVDVDTTTTPWIATKKAQDHHRHGALQKEKDILEKLHTCGVTYVPEVLAHGDGWFRYTWIVGDAFDDVFPIQDTPTQQRLIKEFIQKAYQLDQLGIVHGELDHPMSNILVDTQLLAAGKPALFFIDFERGHWHDFSGKNLRHVMQWLHRIGSISMDQCKQRGSYPPKQIYTLLMKAMKKKWAWAVTYAPLSARGFTVLLIGWDQLTKRLLYDLRWWAGYDLITPLLNTWIWRSIPVPLSVTIAFALILCWGLSRWIYKQQQFPRRARLLIAGAVGNAIDRMLYAGVRDFIDLAYRPVFNLADIYLSRALLLLVWRARNENNAAE